jgi:hypothetical protein
VEVVVWSSWHVRVEIVSWNWDDLDGVAGPARSAQQSVRFCLPFAEVGLGGIGGGTLGMKCTSSVSTASCWIYLVVPIMRPVTNIWVCGANKGNFAHRGPFLKHAVIGNVCWARVDLL